MEGKDPVVKDKELEKEYTVETDMTEEERTKAEIGDKHVDNDEARIEVEDMDMAKRNSAQMLKEQIVGLIEDMEERIKKEAQRRQDNEIELNDAVAEFTTELEGEIAALESHRAEQAEILKDLEEHSKVVEKEFLNFKGQLLKA